ncbi:serine hydrolase FSH [Xylariaceae sp. FL0804]|nr:serine hydrolase FSH [Xylariaceae sp. FL0804]
MAPAEQSGSGEPAQQQTQQQQQKRKNASSTVPKDKRELKILMLHGYTQSGPLLEAKTKALAKMLVKALGPAPFNLHPTFVCPTAPHNLRPSDIPGYVPSESASEEDDDAPSDNWAWWRKDAATGLYRGFEAGMQRVASAVLAAGGVDGVVGFSQGGALAALVAAALEQSPSPRWPPPDTPSPSSSLSSSSSSSPAAAAADWSWLPALRAANRHRPLRFCVVYSGFWAPVPGLQWLYGGHHTDNMDNANANTNARPLATPSLHFLGALDTVVDEGRSRALVDRWGGKGDKGDGNGNGGGAADVLVHPGGHYVPVAREWATALAAWLRPRCEGLGDEQQEEERGEGEEGGEGQGQGQGQGKESTAAAAAAAGGAMGAGPKESL